MVSALVLDPLPFAGAESIVEINNSFPGMGPDDYPASVAQYLDFRAHATALDRVALWRQASITWEATDRPVRLDYAVATAEIFDVLGVQPFLGRFFTSANHRPANDKVVVLARSFWRAHFQEDPSVLGRTLRLDGEAHEVIGVAPAEFESFDARVRFVKPRSWGPQWEAPNSRYMVSDRLFGRLAPNATIGAAFSQVRSLEKRVYEQAASDPARRDFLERSEHRIEMDSAMSRRVGQAKTSLYLLQGGVWFLLLIGCANVTNLLLARANARQNELATRVALGANHGVIARHLLVETVLLTSLGAAIGAGLAQSALGAINRFRAILVPEALPFGLDYQILGYTALVAVGMAVVIGVLPIVRVLGGNLLDSMRARSQGASTSRAARGMSGALIVAETAVALVLLAGAGLLVRSFARVTAVDAGFDPRGVVTARITLPSDYREGNRAPQFARRLSDSLREIPGVSVGLAGTTPYFGDMPHVTSFSLRDHMLPEGALLPSANRIWASPGFREALGVRLLQGRWFEEADAAEGRRVFVVDEDFARRYYPNGGAVGRHLNFHGPPDDGRSWPEIIGVVGNVRHHGAEGGAGLPYVYQPLRGFRTASVFLRTERATAEVVRLLRERVAALDTALAVYGVETMEGVVSASFSRRRGIMLLLVAFATLGLLLAAVGVYGALAYDVSQRTREIGIRGAIGAGRGQITRLILGQGLSKASVGLLIGLGSALSLSHLMSGLLFEVEPTDPISYVIVSVGLLAVATVASGLPAVRAARIDPNSALRVE